MKILIPMKGHAKWHTKTECPGCGAMLHVQYRDLFTAQISENFMQDFINYVCYKCIACGNLQVLRNSSGKKELYDNNVWGDRIPPQK